MWDDFAEIGQGYEVYDKPVLKPCPFCGGASETDKGYFTNFVRCISCGATTPDRKTWNSRKK